MPEFVVEKIIDVLNNAEKSVKGSNIHLRIRRMSMMSGNRLHLRL